MSGIYIKGMEVPTRCWDCYFQDCGNCRLNAHKVVDKCIIEDKRDDACPLIPVPDHGDLIDEKELLTGCGYIIADGMACIPVKHIANAPIIIPADKEDV